MVRGGLKQTRETAGSPTKEGERLFMHRTWPSPLCELLRSIGKSLVEGLLIPLARELERQWPLRGGELPCPRLRDDCALARNLLLVRRGSDAEVSSFSVWRLRGSGAGLPARPGLAGQQASVLDPGSSLVPRAALGCGSGDGAPLSCFGASGQPLPCSPEPHAVRASPRSRLLLGPPSLSDSATGRPFGVFTLAFSMKRKVTTELRPPGTGATNGVRLPGERREGGGLVLFSGVHGAVTLPELGQLLLPRRFPSVPLWGREPVLLYLPSWDHLASGVSPLRRRWSRPALRLGVRHV